MAITKSLAQQYADGISNDFVKSQLDTLNYASQNNVYPPQGGSTGMLSADQLHDLQGRILGGKSPSVAPVVSSFPIASTNGAKSKQIVASTPTSPVNGAVLPATTIKATPKRSPAVSGLVQPGSVTPTSAALAGLAPLAPLGPIAKVSAPAAVAPVASVAPVAPIGNAAPKNATPGHVTVSAPVASSPAPAQLHVPVQHTNAGGAIPPAINGTAMSSDHTITVTAE